MRRGDCRHLLDVRIAERAHLISLIAALPLAALAAVLGRPGFAILLLVPNLMFHGYPVLLQRDTRARLRAILVARQWSSDWPGHADHSDHEHT